MTKRPKTLTARSCAPWVDPGVRRSPKPPRWSDYVIGWLPPDRRDPTRRGVFLEVRTELKVETDS